MDRRNILITGKNSIIIKFDPNCGMDLHLWQNDLEYIFDLLSISDYNKTFFLLNSIDPSVFTMIRNKLYPVDPYDFSYTALMSHLEDLYGIYQGRLAAEYRFNHRDQYPGECATHYALVLNNLINNCSFLTNTTENLYHRFVHGLKRCKARMRLRQIPYLTLEEAIRIVDQTDLEQ